MSRRTTDTELLAELDAKGYRPGAEAAAEAARPDSPAPTADDHGAQAGDHGRAAFGRRDTPPATMPRPRRGRPPKPATAARAALRQAARGLWTNFAFATGTLELHLLEYGLAATRAQVRSNPAAIARPRARQRAQDVARLEAALAALARHIDTAPDAEETPEPYVPMLNSSGADDRRDS